MSKTPTLRLPGYLRALSVLLLIGLIITLMQVGKGVLIPLFLGGIIAVLFTPPVEWMVRKGLGELSACLIALVAGILSILGLLAFVILQVANFGKDLEDVEDRLLGYVEDIEQLLKTNFEVEIGLLERVEDINLIQYVQNNSANLLEFLLGTLGSLTTAILLPIFIFFLLVYRHHLTDFIVEFYKEIEEEKVRAEIKKLRKVVQAYMVGVLKVMAILAVLNTAVLFGLGIKHAIFFGIFAGILNIIPFLGPFLGAILPTIFAFLTKDSLLYPLGVVIAFQIIQLLESNFLTPKIVGSNVNLNAFITFIALLVGAAIWGVVGMIIVIPALAVLKKIFELSPDTQAIALLLGEERAKDLPEDAPQRKTGASRSDSPEQAAADRTEKA
ncbi:MAG: AI-2E family transporter [Nitritalea sp.]